MLSSRRLKALITRVDDLDEDLEESDTADAVLQRAVREIQRATIQRGPAPHEASDPDGEIELKDIDGTSFSTTLEHLKEAEPAIACKRRIELDELEDVSSRGFDQVYSVSTLETALEQLQALLKEPTRLAVEGTNWGESYLLEPEDVEAAIAKATPAANARYISFNFGDYEAFLESNGLLHMGCQHHTLDEWAEQYARIARANLGSRERERAYTTAGLELLPALREIVAQLAGTQRPRAKRAAKKVAKRATKKTAKRGAKRARRR